MVFMYIRFSVESSCSANIPNISALNMGGYPSLENTPIDDCQRLCESRYTYQSTAD